MPHLSPSRLTLLTHLSKGHSAAAFSLLLLTLAFFCLSNWQADDILLLFNYSVQFSCSVVSDSLRPHELQHARPPCPSPTPRLPVHQVNDAIQPSHPLSSPSTPAPNPSQHQSLFQWVNSSHEVAKVLEFQL